MTPLPDLEELLVDLAPNEDSFLDEVVAGLSQKQKTLPSKFFYDERGSRLFERICELDEYYLTRTELGIMERWADDMADRIGPDCALIEYGSGSGAKTRILLDHLREISSYVPVDISRSHLLDSMNQLAAERPKLHIRPVCADFSQPMDLDGLLNGADRKVVYFPGSTIGNFEERSARRLMRGMADLCGPGGGALIGVDLDKDPSILEAAYNDRAGVTAEFNLNILRRINDELDGNFNLDGFEHRACHRADAHRIEMHLVSLSAQTLKVSGHQIAFREGETIHTENCYKYPIEIFRRMAADSGLTTENIWTDPDQFFSVQYLTVG
jgi:dimethylhistidine N-methyltransferase